MNERIAQLERTFALFGFTKTPLSREQIERHIQIGFTDEQVYSVGCDLNSGFAFNEAIEGAR